MRYTVDSIHFSDAMDPVTLTTPPHCDRTRDGKLSIAKEILMEGQEKIKMSREEDWYFVNFL